MFQLERNENEYLSMCAAAKETNVETALRSCTSVVVFHRSQTPVAMQYHDAVETLEAP